MPFTFIKSTRVFYALLCLIFFTYSEAQTFFSKSTGNLNTLSTWGPNTDGSGTSPANFTTAGRTFVITNRTSATIGAAWTVSGAGSKVQVGTGTGGIEFIIPSNFAYTGTVDVMNSGSLTIQGNTNPTIGTLASGSTVNYARAGNQTVLNTTYYNLTLSGSGRKSLANTANTSITNSLNINTGITFRLNTATTFSASISGSVTGSGVFIGNAAAILGISGTGDIGTLTFSTSLALSELLINRTSSGLVKLGSNVTIGSRLSVTNGTLDLNNRLLTLNGAISFPASAANGALKGSATSSIVIGTNATATISNQLFMDQSTAAARSLNQLSFNRAGQTIALGNDLIVEGSLVHTNGAINLNGKSLTLNGAVTFPNAITNGWLTGSSSSSLSLSGSGTYGNELYMDQSTSASRTIGSFTLNHTGGTLTLGNNLICSGTLVHTNGALRIAATLLTLNGAITFPATATNGSVTGSATSSLAIGGSGTISNSLFMSQASAAARTFNFLTFDRINQTLSIGNPLIVTTFVHSNGFFGLGGTLLTLNGAITFPASITNGCFVGSTTSSLSIGTSTTAVTNPILMSQSSTAAMSLSSFTVNRTGLTLTLGNNMVVNNAFALTNGSISLSGKSFSVSGAITFPAAIANGAFIGSATSSLYIGGAGTITNALRLDQTSSATRNLNSFTVNRTSGTVTLGNNIICDGQFVHTSGPITLGATLLTLNGSITLPASASNGSLTGSATSSLAIGGTGAITNSLFMSQASAAARTFNNFSFNRVGQTLSLGNPLIVNTYVQTNGQVNLGGTLLTLSNAITFPATVSNGSFIGSLTSSLTVNGTGAITNSLKMDQTTSANSSLYDLTMNRTGQTLTIGNALEIRNSVLPTLGTLATGGFIKLKADATRSAMIGTVGGTISGNITVETYAPGGFTGWTVLGPSGVTGLKVSNWEGQIYMSCPGCPHDEYSAGGQYFVSIQSFNEAVSGSSAYVPLSYTSNITRGNGYWVFLGNGAVNSTAITYSVNGPAVTGNVVVPVTNSSNSGYNLVANPYAAPIDWDLVTADAANLLIGGSIYVYNPDLGVTISYAAGASNPSGYMTGGVIPMGQGFYVQATSGTNLTMRESHKSTLNTSANPLLRSEKNSAVGDLFRLSVQGSNQDYDETTFRLHADATQGFDRLLDARKIFETPGYVGTPGTYSKYTTISSRLGSDDYSINSVAPNATADITIPVLVRAQATGSYVIAPIEIENLPPDACVSLRDKLLDVSHDLRTGSYTCTISDTTSTPRFELTICGGKIATSVKEQSAKNSAVLISRGNGSDVFVKLNFEQATESTISVYNVLGQKIIRDVELEGKESTTTLNLKDLHNQIVIVKVNHGQHQTVKKIYLD